jgi:DNA-binding XRE family transcriptional regulator
VRKPGVCRGNGRPRGSFDLRAPAKRVNRRTLGVVVAAFPEHLRHVRIGQNVAASELAAAIGVNTRTLHAYESGRTVPPLCRVVAIALALGLPFEHLVPEV